MNLIPGRKAASSRPEGPVVQPVPPRAAVQLARQAAEIEQKVINLQEECEQWRQQAQVWENAAKLAEGAYDQVQAENAALRRENEDLRARHVRIDERIAQSASLVLSCAELLRGAKEGPALYAPKDPEVRRLEAATAAVAAELGLPPDGVETAPRQRRIDADSDTDSDPPPAAPRPPKAA